MLKYYAPFTLVLIKPRLYVLRAILFLFTRRSRHSALLSLLRRKPYQTTTLLPCLCVWTYIAEQGLSTFLNGRKARINVMARKRKLRRRIILRQTLIIFYLPPTHLSLKQEVVYIVYTMSFIGPGLLSRMEVAVSSTIMFQEELHFYLTYY